jgi:hypothetical protein
MDSEVNKTHERELVYWALANAVQAGWLTEALNRWCTESIEYKGRSIKAPRFGSFKHKAAVACFIDSMVTDYNTASKLYAMSNDSDSEIDINCLMNIGKRYYAIITTADKEKIITHKHLDIDDILKTEFSEKEIQSITTRNLCSMHRLDTILAVLRAIQPGCILVAHSVSQLPHFMKWIAVVAEKSPNHRQVNQLLYNKELIDKLFDPNRNSKLWKQAERLEQYYFGHLPAIITRTPVTGLGIHGLRDITEVEKEKLESSDWASDIVYAVRKSEQLPAGAVWTGVAELGIIELPGNEEGLTTCTSMNKKRVLKEAYKMILNLPRIKEPTLTIHISTRQKTVN